ncbi:MAG: hypothetical protein KJO55_09650, partial [Gammaproteobacteria bacterium]|nr:hypothetical protein [Gammaproteobacteria bacterium]
GDGGARAVTVQVDAAGGSVLQAQGEIFTAGNPLHASAAEALTAVESTPALSLGVQFSANPTQPNQLVETHFTVTNLDINPRTVTLKVRYPDGLFSNSPSVFIPAGSCPPSFCDPGEIVTWSLGSVPAGQSVVATMLTTVQASTVLGQLINFFAIVTDTDGGIATSIDTVRLGTCADNDSDCDGIDDTADNCTHADNLDQRDTDGDNIGNVCDADITGPGGADDCLVNFLDLQAVKAAFFATPIQPNWNPDADLDNSGSINFADLQIVKSQFFGPPGPSAGGCN